MQKTAAIVVAACAVLWLTTIAGTVQWLAHRAAPGNASRARDTAAAKPEASGEVHDTDARRLTPAEILRKHYGWFMTLSLTLGLLVYLPIAWLAWLVVRRGRS